MELSDALNLISNTFGDRLHAAAVFEAAGGQWLRVEQAIDGDVFRAVLQTADGSLLNVTPGNVLALLNSGSVLSTPTSTQAALTAWKSQPPITFAPVAAGLNQLVTGNPAVDSVIAAMAQLNGTLAFGFLPDICWYQASYANIVLPGVDLEQVAGRVCLRDVTFSSTTLSFVLDLDAQLAKGTVSLGTGRQVVVAKTAGENVSLRLRASVFLDLPTGRVTGELIHAAATAPSGTVAFDGYTGDGLAASLQILNLELDGTDPRRGFLRASLQPQAGGNAIQLTFPAGKPVQTNNLSLSGFTDAAFQVLDLAVQFEGTSLRPAARLDLKGGQLGVSQIGLQLQGQPGLADQSVVFSAPAGSPFAVGVDRFAYILSADGAATIRLAACFSSPPNVTPVPPLKFGFTNSYLIELDSLGQIKLNAWSVGESDWRLGASVSSASGKLTGPGSGLPGSGPLDITLQNMGLQLVSDEYAPCPPAQAVVRRHAFADFELTLANIPKKITQAAWDGPLIPVSPDAIDQALVGLADAHISSGVIQGIVQFIGGVFQSVLSIAGVIDLDAYLKIDGSYEVDFDPGNSTPDKLSFQLHTATNLTLIVKVYGRLGICPLCIRVQIGSDIKQKVATINLDFQVDVYWQFDTAKNEITFNNVQVHGSGIVGTIGALIMQAVIAQKIETQTIDLPQEFSIRKLNVSFPGPNDPDVTIAVVVGVDKLDWA